MSGANEDRARFPDLAEASLTPAQKTVRDQLTAGPRGGVGGPFKAWIYAPELASRLASLGDYCRFQSSLPNRINELIILLVARRYLAAFVWTHHVDLARKESASEALIDQLFIDAPPTAAQPDEAAALGLVADLLVFGEVRDETWDRAKAAFGEAGIADIIALAGYYVTVCFTIKTMRLTSERDAPFPSATGMIHKP